MRVLISSKNTLIPNGLQQTLSSSRHHVTAHCYQSPDQLIAKSILERSDLVMLDKCDTETFTSNDLRYIREKLPRLKIIVLSTFEFIDFMQHCYTGGVEGYITYDCSSEEIEEALDTVERGQQFFCQKILTILLPRLTIQPLHVSVKALTERETEIALLIADGNTNKQIGDLLCISPHTVHTHRKSLMKKLGVSSAREVALYMISQSTVKYPLEGSAN
jgi:two-component system, NarL family, invasion response regulator UvrY